MTPRLSSFTSDKLLLKRVVYTRATLVPEDASALRSPFPGNPRKMTGEHLVLKRVGGGGVHHPSPDLPHYEKCPDRTRAKRSLTAPNSPPADLSALSVGWWCAEPGCGK